MGKRSAQRGGPAGRASHYRTYSEALRAFASRLKAPDIRRKLLSVAETFSQKADALETRHSKTLERSGR